MSIPFAKFQRPSLIETLKNAASYPDTIFDGYTVKYLGTNNPERMNEFDITNYRENYKILTPVGGDPRELFQNALIKKLDGEYYPFFSVPDEVSIPKFDQSKLYTSLMRSSKRHEQTYLDYIIRYMGKSDTEGMTEYDVFDVRASEGKENYKLRIPPSVYTRGGYPGDNLELLQIKIWGSGFDGEWHHLTSQRPISQLRLNIEGGSYLQKYLKYKQKYSLK
jgi:hypothetical protein